MNQAIRLVRAQNSSSATAFLSSSSNKQHLVINQKPSIVRFREVTTMASKKEESPQKQQSKDTTMASKKEESPQQQQSTDDKAQNPERKHEDIMSHSFGEGYSTRSDEEGFGGIYGGNQTGSNDSVDHPEYDKNQGSEVTEKEKARNQKHVDHKNAS